LLHRSERPAIRKRDEGAIKNRRRAVALTPAFIALLSGLAAVGQEAAATC